MQLPTHSLASRAPSGLGRAAVSNTTVCNTGHLVNMITTQEETPLT